MEGWNGEKMEYWALKVDRGHRRNKIDLIPSTPSFQYPIAFYYGKAFYL